jgi:integrase
MEATRMPRQQGIPKPTIFTNPQGKSYVRVRFPIGLGKYQAKYFGLASDPKSRPKAIAAIAEWLKRDVDIKPDAGLKVFELVAVYRKHAEGYYQPRPGRKRAAAIARIEIAMKFLLLVAKDDLASEFGPNRLREVRDAMVATKKCRTYINYLISCILRAFKWAVSYQLVPVDVHIRLATLEHLKKGRSLAGEGPGRTKTIPIGDIEAAIPYLPEAVAGMVMLQLLTGMRPGEVLGVRAGDISKAGPMVTVDGLPIQLWEYRPGEFKGDHLEEHSLQEKVLLGEKCQKVLAPLLARASDPQAFLFPSSRYRAGQAQAFRAIMGGAASPAKPTKPYSVDGYCRACKRACVAAGVPAWTPKRIRHTRATELRRLFKDADAAQAVLRHRHISTTERYAHLLMDRAAEVMARVG